MRPLRFLALACIVLGSALADEAQQVASHAPPAAPTSVSLRVTKSVKVAEMATPFPIPIECDVDGNIYLKTDTDGYPAIHEFDARGERIATIGASACPDISVQVTGQFSITPDGRVHQLVFPKDSRYRYVVIFNRDGSCHSKIKIDVPFSFVPYQIATFPTGNMLIAGLRWSADPEVKAMWPYTALFSADGTVLKEIELEDDIEIHKLGAQGDPRVTSPGDPSGNKAVARGIMKTASDGNVYLMRRLSPAVVYAISASGAVVRRFLVSPGEVELMPSTMQIAGGRLAILFRNVQTNSTTLKVVDLEGHEVATYQEQVDKGKPQLGLAFACYSASPERFTFLTTFEDNRLGFKIAEPR